MPSPLSIFTLQPFHHLGVADADMVITRQMQHAMHHQMGGMIGKAFA